MFGFVEEYGIVEALFQEGAGFGGDGFGHLFLEGGEVFAERGDFLARGSILRRFDCGFYSGVFDVYGGLVSGGDFLKGFLAFGVEGGAEVFVLFVHVGGDGFADDFKAADEEAAGAAGGVADAFAFPRVEHPDNELDDGARGEELADFAAKGAAEEAFEGDAFDVFAGVGEVVAFEFADDVFDGGGAEVDALVVGEDFVGAIGVFGFVEEGVDGGFGDLGFEEFDGEEVLAFALFLEAALDHDFHEEDFGDFVEGGCGVEVLVVADDVVARVEEVGEFLAFEGF